MSDEKKVDSEERQEPFLGRVSRRSFLSQLGAAGVAATAGPFVASAQTAPGDPAGQREGDQFSD